MDVLSPVKDKDSSCLDDIYNLEDRDRAKCTEIKYHLKFFPFPFYKSVDVFKVFEQCRLVLMGIMEGFQQ